MNERKSEKYCRFSERTYYLPLKRSCNGRFEEKKIEVLVNILPNGTPMKDDGGKILTEGFFVRNVFCRYINVKDDSPAKMFMRCSEILYQMLTQGD